MTIEWPTTQQPASTPVVVQPTAVPASPSPSGFKLSDWLQIGLLCVLIYVVVAGRIPGRNDDNDQSHRNKPIPTPVPSRDIATNSTLVFVYEVTTETAEQASMFDGLDEFIAQHKANSWIRVDRDETVAKQTYIPAAQQFHVSTADFVAIVRDRKIIAVKPWPATIEERNRLFQ